jgi:DNA-binding IclR family transcriptional regulator
MPSNKPLAAAAAAAAVATAGSRSPAKAQAGIQSVEVGFELLQQLSLARSAMMLKDIAAAARMSPAKAHRYLVSFQRLGLVTQDEATARYDLGPGALKLGLACLERIDAVQLARVRLPALMDEIGHTLALAVWGNRGPTMVHWQEPAAAVTASLRLGDVMPLLTSATGQCFAAYKPLAAMTPLLKTEVATLARTPRRDVPRTMNEVQTLLAQVRQQGLARVVDVLIPGIAGFCAPVFEASGQMVLGMVSLGPTASFDSRWDGAVARALKAAAQQLSSDLGFEPSRRMQG